MTGLLDSLLGSVMACPVEDCYGRKMITNKKRVTSFVASTLMGVGALTFAGAGAAQAVTPNHSVGPFSTSHACEVAKRSYISSWTKISQGCTYYPKQGGFTDNGYYFHYRAIA